MIDPFRVRWVPLVQRVTQDHLVLMGLTEPLEPLERMATLASQESRVALEWLD